jgi:hypothetical protein
MQVHWISPLRAASLCKKVQNERLAVAVVRQGGSLPIECPNWALEDGAFRDEFLATVRETGRQWEFSHAS